MDASKCKVSIITVVYNGVNTIEQTIKSVLGQTYKNIEYIIIDGASTDGTQQIIEKYANDISYYISEKDEGLYYAMNKGIERATGEIIGIINSDDWYDANAVINIVECFNQKNAELVYGQTAVVAENGIEKICEAGSLQTIWYAAPFLHPSVFVKKSVYDRFGVFNVNYIVASDYDLLLRFYSENVRFGYCDKVIAHYRLGGISTTFREVGYKEDYKISISYLNKCPYKEYVLTKIKECYDKSCFNVEIQKNKGLLRELLCEYFHETITAISIFGTGVWGKRYYKILADDGMEILCFADNDVSKQEKDFYGIKVISPELLNGKASYVLIAVKEYGEEIKRQLENSGNKELKCVSIEELRTFFTNRKSMRLSDEKEKIMQ